MLHPKFQSLLKMRSYAPYLPLLWKSSIESHSSGTQSIFSQGQGLEFEKVKEYQPGDDIRHIDWRVTARMAKPHTKVFRKDQDCSAIISVDMSGTMRFGTRKTFKSVQAAYVAALLGWSAHINHNKLGACLFGDIPSGIQYLPPKSSRSSLLALFKHLTDPLIGGEGSATSLNKNLEHLNRYAPKSSHIYIISDFHTLDSDLEKNLIRLKKRCHIILIAIDDPADHTLLPIGPVILQGVNKKTVIDTNNQIARRTYYQMWKNTRDHLIQIAKKNRINFISLSTKNDIETELPRQIRITQKK